MARRGSFGRSGTTQNLSVLVYQLVKEQMSTELTNILNSYETNMKDGRYTSQFNGQNVDGEYVMTYMSQMLAGFPPGSTEYETLNSQLASFRSRYQRDVQNLVIDSMNNGTQIDFGLLGPSFSNKGIAEVELTDVRNWADGEIASLLENGDSAQADKIKGAVFVAGFNVENDGKVAAVNNESMTRGQYNDWLKGQLQGALNAGYTKDSETYRGILKLQADAAKQAKVEGEVKAAESVTKQFNSIKTALNDKARDMLQAYADASGINMDEINALIGKAQGNFKYYETLQTLASAIGAGGEYDGFYGDITRYAGDQLLSEFNSLVVSSQSELIDLRENGLDGLSEEDRVRIKGDLDGEIATNNAYVSRSGIPFSAGGSLSALDSLYTGLSSAGVYFRNDGSTKVGQGGHPEAVFDVMKQFGDQLKDVEGYSLLKSLAQGNIPVTLIEGSSELIQDNNPPDGVISAAEWKTAFENGLSRDTFAEIEEAAATKAATLVMPSVGGSATISPKSLVSIVLGAHMSSHLLATGGQVVMNSTGMVTITDNAAPGGPLARPALIKVGGKTYGGISEPMTITQVTEGEQAASDWATTNTNMQINVYRTGGPGDKNAGIYVSLVGGLEGPNGKAPNGIIIPYDKFKRWMRDVAGIDIDDRTFMVPNSQEPAAIRIASTDRATAEGIDINKALAGITNPDSEYFIGRSTTGKGAGIMQITEAGVTSLQDPGFITDPANVKGAIDEAFKNPSDIFAKATEYANARGGQVTQKDLIKAVYASIPGIPTTYNMDLQAEQFGKFGDVGARITALFPTIKSTGSAMPQVPVSPSGIVRPDMVPGTGTSTPASTNPYESTLYTPSGVPRTTPVTPADPSGKKDDGNPFGFLGEVFRNVPNIFGSGNPRVSGMPIPTKPNEIKPTTGVKPKDTKPVSYSLTPRNRPPGTGGRV
jgi:hypothetical protein